LAHRLRVAMSLASLLVVLSLSGARALVPAQGARVSQRHGIGRCSATGMVLADRDRPILLNPLKMTSRPTMFQEESFARLARDATLSRSLETAAAAAAAAPVAEKKEQAEVNLWPWRFLMLGITASWGCNFAVIKLALDTLGDSASAGSLFMAARFGLAALLLAPALFKASSRSVVEAGAAVGMLCAAGYGCQAASLAMGTAAGTSAFICSLQAVVVALLVSHSTGVVERRTMLAIVLAVAGVGCLELPSVLADGGGFALADLLSFGQPLGFGASYVVLEKAAADATDDDALPLAALQCAVIAAGSLLASSAAAGAWPSELDWSLMLPHAEAANGVLAQWAVPGAVLYTGVISTALTIWLQALVFAKLPAVDASIMITTEPLWAALCAVLLLGDTLTAANYVGGALILSALAAQNGLLPGMGEEGAPADTP